MNGASFFRWIGLLLLCGPTMARAQSMMAAAPAARACEGCTPAQSESLLSWLAGLKIAAPALKNTSIRIELKSGDGMADFSMHGIHIVVPPGTTHRHLRAILSHELGHAEFYRLALQEKGLSGLETADEDRLQTTEKTFPGPVFRAVRGSCRAPEDLVGVRRAFHELAADVFSYFILDRQPTELAEAIATVFPTADLLARRFDQELGDAVIRKRLYGHPDFLVLDAYSALSQVKHSVHLQPDAQPEPVLELLVREYRRAWEHGCGRTPFTRIRDRIRRKLWSN
jgi:hypothetical protein